MNLWTSTPSKSRNRAIVKGTICILAGAALALILPPSLEYQAKAQESSSEPVCLVSTGSAYPITIIVPQSRADGLAAQGFATVSCGSAPDVAKYRSQICGLAQTASEAVKAGFASAYAIRPETLCTYAQEIG
ncbi:MAG: hypothetical protein AAF249_12885 [Pseudomonadota bacterium]